MIRNFVSYALSGLVTLLAVSCGPSADAPDIPEATVAYSGNGDLESDDANENPNATPTDSLVKTRLQGLPTQLTDRIEECESEGNFYNLGDKSCTKEKRTDFPCTINDEFLTHVDKGTLTSLDSYLKTKARKFQLYACTESQTFITLHFFTYAKNSITYKKLNIAKAE